MRVRGAMKSPEYHRSIVTTMTTTTTTKRRNVSRRYGHHWSTVIRGSVRLPLLLLLSCVAERGFAEASTIYRHTATGDDNDTSTMMMMMEHANQDQPSQQFPVSAAATGGGGSSNGPALAPASLQAASPQTMTLTADKNKTKLLKCHCDICKDENYVCETDGVCFTSLTREADGSLKYSYR
uniref:Putative activin receptor type i n=1 Tax=Anopheles darlingi TaxID=43151 RepID=A0A2M4CV82_ANODA